MRIFKSSSEIIQYLNSLDSKETIGFVPTMGALHEGHSALIQQSVRENDYTICSIFVNPLQFNRKEDLDTYPDRMEADISILEKDKCNILFNPQVADIFPDNSRLNYDFGSIGKGMEADYRPGHFQGVAEVIHRFFNILKPHKAYFGEKDYQQIAIVRWLTEKYGHDTEIVECTTIRESSGLAMSSRNYNLSPEQYERASELYRVLSYCKENKGKWKPKDLAAVCYEKLSENFKPEYFTIADQYSMIPLDTWTDSKYPRAFVAAYCGDVRLIDNLALIDNKE